MMWRRLIMALLVAAALGFSALQPAQAQAGVSWNASFYNNLYLLGNPVLQRVDNAIAFNWGTGSPGPGVNSDNFSARWGADVSLPGGTYRFFAQADDAVRITVNFSQVVIDTFERPAVGQIVSGDITIPGGSTHIQVDYREVTGDAYIFVSWANAATNPTAPNFPAPVSPQPQPIPGGAWTAQYYSNRDLAGSPVLIRSEGSPNYNWGAGAPDPAVPADNFSVRWTSQQNLAAGTYRITVRADDGVRVIVNGSRVIDEWRTTVGQTYVANIAVPGGINNIQVEYFEATGDAFIEFRLEAVAVSQPPPPPTAIPPIGIGGQWLAYYYNNPNLSGDPVAILTVPTPSANWGFGSPLSSVQPDNFSIRYTSTQNFTGGLYRITARADDGVRIYVNGQLVINQWRGSAGNETYTADVNLRGGSNTLTIEYFEATGSALLDVNIAPITSVAPTQQPPADSGAVATVTAQRLNVRNIPSANNSSVLTQITRGQTFPVVGRNAASTWWQINVNGTVGWVFGNFVDVANRANVPVTSGEGAVNVAPSGYSVVAVTTVNIRSEPSTRGAILGRFPTGRVAQVVGRNAASTWWQIDYSGVTGWVSASFARIDTGADLGRIPVTN